MAELQALVARVRRLLIRFRRPLAALVSGLAVLALIEALAPATPATRPTVVAAHDLAAGRVLGPGDLVVAHLPPGLVPVGTESTTSRLLGHTIAGPMRRGEPVTDRRMLGPPLLAGFRPGLVACPVRVQDAAAVGLLEVGERVNLYAPRNGASTADLIVARTTVLVLPASGEDPSAGGLAVLAVTPGQAAALIQAAAQAPLSLTLTR